MPVDVKDVMEGLKFGSDEERKTFEKIFSDSTNLETFSRRQLRREEGTRLAQAKADAERDATQARAEADKERQTSVDHMAALNLWKEEESVRLKADAQQEVTRFKQELRARGIDPDGALGTQLQNQNLNEFRQDAAPNMDSMRKELGKEYLDIATARSIAQTAIDLPFQTMTVMEDVKRIMGAKPIDYVGFQEAARANLVKGVGVRETAETFFKLPEERMAQERTAMEAQVRAQLETEYQERLAKANLPGFNAPAHVDPLDKMFTKEFSENTRGGGSDDPNFAAAKDHFLQVNAELESAGVHMMKG